MNHDLQPYKERILADAKSIPALHKAINKTEAYEATVAWLVEYCAHVMADRDHLEKFIDPVTLNLIRNPPTA